MRRLILLLINTTVQITSVIYLVPLAIAQETDNCFMINSAGTIVNLSKLCSNSTKTTTQPQIFTTKIKRRYGGTPVVDVTFDGKQQFEMLLDTGATQTTITATMATQLGLIPIGTQTVQVASGEAVVLPVGRVASIQVGGATVNNAKVLVAPLPLLGQNFFSTYDITIKQDVVEFHVRS